MCIYGVTDYRIWKESSFNFFELDFAFSILILDASMMIILLVYITSLKKVSLQIKYIYGETDVQNYD